MSIAALDAIQTYGRVGGLKPAFPKPAETGAPSAGFGDMVEGLVTNAAGAMRQAEQASAAQVAGKGDLVDVVTAIGSAEMALDTVVAVRDRVVSAYSEIMRMQI